MRLGHDGICCLAECLAATHAELDLVGKIPIVAGPFAWDGASADDLASLGQPFVDCLLVELFVVHFSVILFQLPSLR